MTDMRKLPLLVRKEKKLKVNQERTTEPNVG